MWEVLIFEFRVDPMLMHSGRKITFIIRSLTLAVLLCSGALPGYAAEQEPLIDKLFDSAEQLAAYQQQIEDLESEFGPYHTSLIEPIESMIELLNEAEDYTQVEQLQNRQMQVMRTELGFENPDLIPLLRSMAVTQLALGNWEEVSDQLDHIRHLRATIDGENTALLLATIQDQIDWQFNRIAVDDPKEQASNFFRVRELYREMEDIVEKITWQDGLDAVPWLYRIAHNDYHLFRFLNASKGLASDAIDELVRQEGSFRLNEGQNSRSVFGISTNMLILDSDRPIGEAYLRDAYLTVKQLQDLIDESADLETRAMLMIYSSDYQMLFGRGTTTRGYRQARRMLLESGVAAEDVSWFFERPMPIPMQNLHLNFADALAELKGRIEPIASVMEEPVMEEKMHLGVFNSWTEALGSTQMPEPKNAFWQMNYPFKYADVSFSVSSRGKVNSVDILATGPEEIKSKGSILRAMRKIQFRPALIDDKNRRVEDVHMRYQFIDQ